MTKGQIFVFVFVNNIMNNIANDKKGHNIVNDNSFSISHVGYLFIF